MVDDDVTIDVSKSDSFLRERSTFKNFITAKIIHIATLAISNGYSEEESAEISEKYINNLLEKMNESIRFHIWIECGNDIPEVKRLIWDGYIEDNICNQDINLLEIPSVSDLIM